MTNSKKRLSNIGFLNFVLKIFVSTFSWVVFGSDNLYLYLMTQFTCNKDLSSILSLLILSFYFLCRKGMVVVVV